MRVMTILGASPEIIRLSLAAPLLDKYAEHILVHIGREQDEQLSAQVFQEVGMRQPDEKVSIRGHDFGDEVGQVLSWCAATFARCRPDRLLALGESNSSMAVLVARHLGIPVYHVAAGSRCYDDRSSEEINRRVIDHASSVFMPYTVRGRENLLREGIPGERIHVVGCPLGEVIAHYSTQIAESRVLDAQQLESGKYFFVTLQRAEQVEDPKRLRLLFDAWECLHLQYGFPVICALHARLRAKVLEHGVDIHRAGIRCIAPLGFFDLIALERAAFCLISDSESVQEEACLLGVPHVTLGETTPYPETVECGANMLAEVDVEQITRLVEMLTETRLVRTPPAAYQAQGVAERIGRILLSSRRHDTSTLVRQPTVLA